MPRGVRTAGDRAYPPDIDRVPADHDFFSDLCELIEEYEDYHEMERERLLYSLQAFSEVWLETMYMTGKTW